MQKSKGNAHKRGWINLCPLYNYARRNTEVPMGRSKAFSAYAAEIRKLASTVPFEQGLYMWGNVEGASWYPIYVGRAGKALTSSLQNRIHKELHAERAFLWIGIQGREKVAKQYDRVNPMYSRSEMGRHERKVGSQFIVWITCPELSEVELNDAERHLIRHYHPRGNTQRGRPRGCDDQAKYLIRELADEVANIIYSSTPVTSFSNPQEGPVGTGNG